MNSCHEKKKKRKGTLVPAVIYSRGEGGHRVQNLFHPPILAVSILCLVWITTAIYKTSHNLEG